MFKEILSLCLVLFMITSAIILGFKFGSFVKNEIKKDLIESQKEANNAKNFCLKEFKTDAIKYTKCMNN